MCNKITMGVWLIVIRFWSKYMRYYYKKIIIRFDKDSKIFFFYIKNQKLKTITFKRIESMRSNNLLLSFITLNKIYLLFI